MILNDTIDDEQCNRDIVKTTEGRYIGGGRDTSAPTEGRIILFISISIAENTAS